jgi:peptidoglycan/LPS O-acetylase OafA/YrhL
MSQPEGHRPDVDGLRGVAVLLVVVFHAWPTLLPGGFVGVDVFFVISGFVVSRMVQRQLDANTFTARDFYLRRINRLAPALLLSVTVTLVVAGLWAPPSMLSQLADAAVGGLAMVGNLLAGLQSSYFDAGAELRPLLHLWSLGVEEQFYLLVPLTVWLVCRFPASRRRLGVGAMVLSLLGCVLLTTRWPTWAYYLPLTRAWELLAGVLLTRSLSRGASLVGVTGLVLVVGSAALLGRGQVFPGAWAVLPVSGAVLVMASGPSSAPSRLLATRPLVALGLVSYSLYLWHWPVLTLLRLTTNEHPLAAPAGVGISVLLAWLTTRFVERPLRARRSIGVSLGLVSGAVTISAVLVWAQLSLAPEDWAWRHPEWGALNRFLRLPHQGEARMGTCLLTNHDLLDASRCVEQGPPNAPLVVVWGDSFAGQLSAGLRRQQRVNWNFRLGQLTRGSCQPLLSEGGGFCEESNDAVLAALVRLQPETLVLHAMWVSPTFEPDRLEQTLAKVVPALPKTKVLVVGQPPLWGIGLPYLLTRVSASAGPLPERLAVSDLAVQREREARLEALSRRRGAHFVSGLEDFCSADGSCLVKLSDNPLVLTSWDYGHLTAPAAQVLARRVLASAERLGHDEAP